MACSSFAYHSANPPSILLQPAHKIDASIPQAMTPPEYGLDEFVDGVEALDMPDDIAHKVADQTDPLS